MSQGATLDNRTVSDRQKLDDALLGALPGPAAPFGARTGQLAALLGVKPRMVYDGLQRLQAKGKAERRGSRNAPEYRRAKTSSANGGSAR